jgi:uncharacterized repeat protein (TIGR01451 family)
MKKLLSLLIFLFCLGASGQNSQATITVCDFWDSSPDLLQTTFTNYEPSTHTYTLHQTTAGALENTNLIPIGIPITASMTLYLRIVNTNTQEISIEPLTILLNPIILSGATTLDAPTSNAICSVESGGTAPFTFTWSIEGTVVTEGSTSTLTIPPSNQESVIICTVTDATGCTSTFSIQIVSAASAYNDTVTIATSETEIVTSNSSVFDNDYLNFQSLTFPVIQQQVYLTEDGTGWENFNLNENGTISALPGTAAGTYNLQYSIFRLNNQFVGSANITLNVLFSAFELIAFVDLNTNGVKEANEPYFSNGYFSVSGSNGSNELLYANNAPYVYAADINTQYNIDFTVDNLLQGLYSSNATFENVLATAQNVSTFYFPVIVNLIPNGTVNLFSYQSPSPGFTRSYGIKLRNNSFVPIVNATLDVQKPAESNIANYCSGCEPTATGFTKTNISINPFEELFLYYSVQFNTIPDIELGEYLTTVATFNVVDEGVPNDNTASLTQMVVGSYDPNDILEKNGPEIVFANWPTNNYLEYTVRFENTGNGPATIVRLENTLPSNVDSATLEPVDASHSYILKREGNHITVVFNDIDLPPSVPETLTGHGYFTYRVKPTAGFTVGTQIENTAEIYFDFNPPIVTPTWTTTFVEQLSVDEQRPFVQFYTNPVTDVFELTLVNPETSIDAHVYDLLGKKVGNARSINGKLQIQTQSWSRGVYILKLFTTNGTLSYKLVKE